MTDLEKLKNTLTEIGIPFKIESSEIPTKDKWNSDYKSTDVLVIESGIGDNGYAESRFAFLNGKFVEYGTWD